MVVENRSPEISTMRPSEAGKIHAFAGWERLTGGIAERGFAAQQYDDHSMCRKRSKMRILGAVVRSELGTAVDCQATQGGFVREVYENLWYSGVKYVKSGQVR